MQITVWTTQANSGGFIISDWGGDYNNVASMAGRHGHRDAVPRLEPDRQADPSATAR